jgi:hypothetical protein
MTLKWQEALGHRLAGRDIIILHGNIHDSFPSADSEGASEGLEDIVRRLIVGNDAQADLFRPINLAHPAARDTPARQPQPAAPQSDASANRAIETLHREVDECAVAACHYVSNLMVSMPPAGNWREVEWTRHARLIEIAKLVRARRHKLVLVFPSESGIPVQLLEGMPGVVRFAIPLPDAAEREQWATSCLPEARRKLSRRVAGLTEGLSWAELTRLGSVVTTRSATDTELDSTIRLFRSGVQRDDWDHLRQNRDLLRSAFTRIAIPRTDKQPLGSDEPLVGQDDAVHKAVQAVNRACFDVAAAITPDYRRPRAVLFFVGPTGVGKTMLAKKLAQLIFGTPESCIVLDMSEYTQEHSEARLIGAPPGYTGYSEGGQLTSALRERPFSVVLFDEIDKAHPKIFTKFLQILDEGRLTDGRGQTCDFSQSLVIFTSNQCSRLPSRGDQNPHWLVYSKLASGDIASRVASGSQDEVVRDGEQAIPVPARNAPADKLAEYYRTALRHTQAVFDKHPEIFNRIGPSNIIPFRHIDDPQMARQVVFGLMDKLENFFRERHQIEPVYADEERIADIVLKSSDFENLGLRNVNQQFEALVGGFVADRAMSLAASGGGLQRILVNPDGLLAGHVPASP